MRYSPFAFIKPLERENAGKTNGNGKARVLVIDSSFDG